MTKQTKMLLGVGALAVVGYLVWTKMSGTKANASGKMARGFEPRKKECEIYSGRKTTLTNDDGTSSVGYECAKPKGVYTTTPPSK